MKTALISMTAAASLFASVAGAANVNDVAFELQDVSMTDQLATATLSVTNKGSVALSMVFLECAFLDAEKKAVDVGEKLVNNLAPGETGYAKVNVRAQKRMKDASCRISQVAD